MIGSIGGVGALLNLVNHGNDAGRERALWALNALVLSPQNHGRVIGNPRNIATLLRVIGMGQSHQEIDSLKLDREPDDKAFASRVLARARSVLSVCTSKHAHEHMHAHSHKPHPSRCLAAWLRIRSTGWQSTVRAEWFCGTVEARLISKRR